jgi:hypothetical protein
MALSCARKLPRLCSACTRNTTWCLVSLTNTQQHTYQMSVPYQHAVTTQFRQLLPARSHSDSPETVTRVCGNLRLFSKRSPNLSELTPRRFLTWKCKMRERVYIFLFLCPCVVGCWSKERYQDTEGNKSIGSDLKINDQLQHPFRTDWSCESTWSCWMSQTQLHCHHDRVKYCSTTDARADCLQSRL